MSGVVECTSSLLYAKAIWLRPGARDSSLHEPDALAKPRFRTMLSVWFQFNHGAESSNESSNAAPLNGW